MTLFARRRPLQVAVTAVIGAATLGVLSLPSPAAVVVQAPPSEVVTRAAQYAAITTTTAPIKHVVTVFQEPLLRQCPGQALRR